MASGSKADAYAESSDSNKSDDEYMQMVKNFSEEESPDRTEAINKSMSNLNSGLAKMMRQFDTLSADFKHFCPNNVHEEKRLRDAVLKLVMKPQDLRRDRYNNEDSGDGEKNNVQIVEDNTEDDTLSHGEDIEKRLLELNIGVADMLEQLQNMAAELKEFFSNHVGKKKLLREEVLKLVKKTQELGNKHFTNK